MYFWQNFKVKVQKVNKTFSSGRRKYLLSFTMAKLTIQIEILLMQNALENSQLEYYKSQFE